MKVAQAKEGDACEKMIPLLTSTSRNVTISATNYITEQASYFKEDLLLGSARELNR